MTGIVKFWNPAEWGIITPDGVKLGDREREVFVHKTRLPKGVPKLDEGQEVEYALDLNFRQPRVLWLKILNRAAYVPIDSGRKAVAAHGD